jgi:hypothetical protein
MPLFGAPVGRLLANAPRPDGVVGCGYDVPAEPPMIPGKRWTNMARVVGRQAQRTAIWTSMTDQWTIGWSSTVPFLSWWERDGGRSTYLWDYFPSG